MHVKARPPSFVDTIKTPAMALLGHPKILATFRVGQKKYLGTNPGRCGPCGLRVGGGGTHL
eukprot:1723339-Lingulodinium_polyedra.AAC.1